MAFVISPPNTGATDHSVARIDRNEVQPTNPGLTFIAAPYAGGIHPDTPQTHALASLTG